MLTDVFDSPTKAARLLAGPAGGHLDDFSNWLSNRGYTRLTIASYARAADRFSRWIQTQDPNSLIHGHSLLKGYRLQLSATSGSLDHTFERGNYYCGARRFVAFLCDTGIASAPTQFEDDLVAAFCHWLSQHRGVGEATLNEYRRVARKIVQELGSDPTDFTTGKLRLFVLQHVRGRGRSQTESIATSVRMFIRYLVVTGQAHDCMNSAIPSVAGWRKSSLPKYLPAAEIERAIEACDRTTSLGARDHAIVLLLARLALRAGDVANLKCADIDWHEARIRVSGKSRRENWLPVPQDVGDAILYYVEHARRQVDSDHLFILNRAPYTPILARQVSQTAQRALQRAKVKTPSYGAHIFRHSAATQMLRNGATLREIGALLRHNDFDTTALYAKVDVDLLRQVAQAWPQDVSSC